MVTEQDNTIGTAQSGQDGDLHGRIYLAWTAFAEDRAALVALAFLLIVALLAIFAPLVSPHDPYDAVNYMRNAAPGSEGFLLGADSNGRDILTRLIYGGRISLVVGFAPTFLAMAISLILGLAAGYFGGWVHAPGWTWPFIAVLHC